MGKFLALRSFLATHGITHLITPPYTPEHNWYSERQHRHIVKTGLTLLHQASIPLPFWPYVFATTIYLINRMPKVSISLGSLFEKLFNKSPDPPKLRVFGCVPILPIKSIPNLVLVSFSATPSLRVPCFDQTLKKIFVSCHVKFVEKNISRSLLYLPLPH